VHGLWNGDHYTAYLHVAGLWDGLWDVHRLWDGDHYGMETIWDGDHYIRPLY